MRNITQPDIFDGLDRLADDVSRLGRTNTNDGITARSYGVVQDEGIVVPQHNNLNFVGKKVRVVDDSGSDRTNIFIDETRIDLSNYPVIVPEVDDTGRFARAYAALVAAGGKGELYVPKGSYSVSAFPNMDGVSSIIISGDGGKDSNASTTSIVYTGTGSSSALSIRSSVGVYIHDIHFYVNTGFTGKFVDFGISAVLASAHNEIYRCSFDSVSNHSHTWISINNCYGHVIDRVRFGQCKVAIKGKETNSDFCNSNTIVNCEFHNSEEAPIQDLHQGCSIINSIGEGLLNTNAGMYSSNASLFGSNNLSIIGGWWGDVNTSGDWVKFTGNGLVVKGVYIAGGNTGVRLTASSESCEVSGNQFFGQNGAMTNGIYVEASCSKMTLHPNSYSNVTNNVVTVDEVPGSIIPNGTTVELRGVWSTTTAPTSSGNITNKSYVDSVTPWIVELSALPNPILNSSSWSAFQASTYMYGGARVTNGSQNEEIGWDVLVGAGTWRVDLIHDTAANRGIYSIRIDGTQVATIDGYISPGGGPNTIVSSSTFSISATGKKRLSLKMAAKNASSAGYYGSIQHVRLTRTA